MANSMVHLVKFFLLGKKSYEEKRRCRYFSQNIFFTDVLSVAVLKLAIITVNCVECVKYA